MTVQDLLSIENVGEIKPILQTPFLFKKKFDYEHFCSCVLLSVSTRNDQ